MKKQKKPAKEEPACFENQEVNVRSVVWRVLCQIDDIKDRCIQGYYQQRAEKMRAQKAHGD